VYTDITNRHADDDVADRHRSQSHAAVVIDRHTAVDFVVVIVGGGSSRQFNADAHTARRRCRNVGAVDDIVAGGDAATGPSLLGPGPSASPTAGWS
jgi:hypothetical protein